MNARRPIALAVSAAISAFGGGAARSAELPLPCVAGVCGANIPGFVSAGRATATATGNTLTVHQQSDRAILNWASFNVGADGRVVFEQPGANSIALNRIFQGSPSRILGAVEANGQIFLINQNGFMFGPTARVRTSGLMVSSLDMADSTFDNGLLSPDLLRNAKPALESDGRMGVLDRNGNPVLGDDGQPLAVKITIAAGAQISTLHPGERVMLASRVVDNAGQIGASEGQVIVAAGEKVYLQASTDPALRGLLVEVDAGGEAWNRMTGSISAAKGNVTVVGLAVNQQGRISATTSVNANGSIRLLARDTVRVEQDVSQNPVLTTLHGGTLELGANSVTSVLPELADRTTALDEQTQLPSTIELTGRGVYLRGGAEVHAPGGKIGLRAQNDSHDSLGYDPEARVRVESGAVLDVKGSDATASVSRNVVRVELRGNELRDAPLQRDGVLRGKEVYVDVRVGTPLADVSGALAGIGRAIDERTANGGTITVESSGDVAVAPGAAFDVSGGTLQYTGGAIQTTQLITADGRAVDIGAASPDQTYIGLINPTVQRRFDRWGVTEQVPGPYTGRYETGYVEGRSAGTLQFIGRALSLDGHFLGGVTTGPSQRDAAHAPAAGRFIVGAPNSASVIPDFRAPSINLVTTAPPVSIGDDASLPQRPLDLATSFITRGGFSRVELYSNGVVHIPEAMMLALAPGGSLAITAHRVESGGTVTVAGGSIRFASVLTAGVDNAALPRAGVALGAGSSLDVSGLWNNELTLLSPIYRNAGTIDLAVNSLGGELVLGDRTQLLADGGASLSAAGATTGGKGGQIGVHAGATGAAFEAGKGLALSAFGVAGATGGSLSLDLARIEIVSAAQASALAPQRIDLSGGDTGFVSIGDNLFSQFGFAAFDLAATGPRDSAEAMVVRSGVTIDARTRTRLLDSTAADRLSGTAVGSFSSVALAPDYLRSPSSVSLRVAPREFSGADSVGLLSIERDARIRVDARGRVALTSVGGISVGGIIDAPAGSVTISVPTPVELNERGYLPDLGISFLDSAVVDVSGISLLKPSDIGLMQGDVLAGGAISVLADRGFIAAASGARFEASGASSALDIPGAGVNGGFLRRTIGSAGGSLTLRSPESIDFDASFAAHAGTGDTRVAGGSATIQLTRQRSFSISSPQYADTFSTDPRILVVTADPSLSSAGRNGLGVIDPSMIRASGIDQLNLEAGDRIEFYSGSDLSLGRSLRIAAPLIGLSGDAVALAAPYISLGTLVDPSAVATPQPLPGTGHLTVHGDLVELTGRSAFTGIADATIVADSEIRMRGFENAGTSVGSLSVASDLTLAAPLIYPTTETTFSIVASGGANDRVRFTSNGAPTSRTPFSVGGTLEVHARSIEQATRVAAPFGRIKFDATDNLTLADGSITSVSAAGALLPFGRIQLGSQWTYDLGATQLLDPRLATPSVDLNAGDVRISASATVDLAGGGDLYAYEWTPGTGGSRDALAPGAIPGLYAILPQMLNSYAPYDPEESFGSSLAIGDSVYLSGIPGLADGVYPLLPARYALLPGALLVSPVAGTADAAPGVATRLADGTPIASGYRTFGNSGIRDARTMGFAVRPGSYARSLATYTDSYASTFSDAGRPLAPDDAAHLSLSATRSFDLAGRVNSAPHGNGAGAAIDIAAPNLAVRAHGAVDMAGSINVDASILASWNSASLLLGGRRSGNSNLLGVVSDTVTVGEGAELAGSEILAVAHDRIYLDTGSSLSSTGTATLAFEDSAPLRLAAADFDAAVLGVSSTRALTVDRTAGGIRGEIVAADGSRLASSGALLLDAPRGVQFAGTIAGAGATWALGSNDIVFGSGVAADQFRIGGTLISSLGSAARLVLAADNSLRFEESLQFGGFDELVLATPNILAAHDGIDVRLDAARLTMRSNATESVSAAGGGSTLVFNARDVFVEPGSVSVDGFGALSITAAREIVGVGKARLAVGGDVTLTAANIGAASDADLSIWSGGTLTTVRGAPLRDEARAARDLGGHVALGGVDVVQGGRIRVASGRIDIDGSNSVTLTSSAVLDASGTAIAAAGRQVGSAGGDIHVRSGGTIDARAGSQLRVAGAVAADAGSVLLTSAGAAEISSDLVATAASAARGGSFVGSFGSLANFGTLNDALEAGRFDQLRSISVATGDLNLAAGHVIHARDVELSTAGQLVVAGTIDASSGNERGRVQLFGGAGLTLASGGRIDARGDSGLGRGGSVLLATDSRLELQAGSAIAVGGTVSAGELRLRAPATSDGMNLGTLMSDISGVDVISLEPVLAFSLTANPTSADFASVRNSVTEYVDVAAPAMLARYAGATAALSVRPAIDVSTVGNLTLGSLELSGWRFAGEAARLAFSATGDLTINGTISDGFVTVGTGTNARLDLLSDRSSSLSFAAGGDLRLGGNARVRTGTGDLNFAAGHDMIFGANASAYTAGVPAEPTHVFTGGVSLALPTAGGDMSIAAAHDVLGAPVTQSVGTWQLRQGRDQIAANGSIAPPGWGTDVKQFGWNVGTLGGGDLRVRAGNDIRDLSAAAADSASIVNGVLTNFGGGVLNFEAGNDIDSAFVHVTRGDNRLRAGGEFGRSRSTSFGELLGSVFSVQDAGLSLQARRGIALETVFNPTALIQAQTSPFFRSFFLSYGSESRLQVASATGDLVLSGSPDQRLLPFLGLNVVRTSDPALSLFPGRVSFEATDGDIRINGPLTLAPSDDGQLAMFASRDIIGVPGSQVIMSDAVGLPTALNPSIIGTLGANVSHAAASGRHANDAQPIQIAAGRDIDGLRVELAKFTELSAGRDLRNLAFTTQNVRDSDATLLSAGRDIVYDLDAGNSQIQVGGPGRLDIVAGRDVDLGFSAGISTVGRLLNPALASESGASITVLAGAGNGTALNAARFVANIVAPTAEYRNALISFVADATHSPAGAFEAAVENFGTLATDLQRAFLVPLFFKELVNSGREANKIPGAGFERGYAAIDALFPGSRGDAAASPYAGDLKLAFSRIYTLADADISLLVPGGLLNVGLANPPPGLAGSRKPSELGIVAQRAGSVHVFTRDDVLVNASRIFTLRGGDIAIWSTLGDIDAGRGAKSAISAPPPTILVDSTGKVTIDFAGAVAGSGIRAIVTDEDVKPGDVDLIAPSGIVDAGDAGIGSAGNLNVAAQQVVGLDNIQVGGTSTGVPAETSNLGAALSGASAVASSATSAASDATAGVGANQSAAPLADSAFGFLDVFLEGFGTEVCKPDDTECLKRSK